MRSRAAIAFRVLIAVSFLLYAAWAMVLARWWLSGGAALVVAWLLWRRRPRARFAAYVLLTVVATRAALDGAWGPLAWAVATLVALQMPSATRMWPRVRAGRSRSTGGVE